MSEASGASDAKRKALVQAVLLGAALIGVALLSKALGLGAGISVLLFFASMLLAIPLIRTLERAEAASGCASMAGRRYGRRMIIAAMLYAVTLVGAIWLSRIGTYSTPIYVAIALAPSFPVIAMIWAMSRLLVEEQDEYLRTRHVHHALVATGVTLTLASVWGFLEQFDLVEHVASYWVFPAWVFGFGISQIRAAVRS